MLSKTLTVTVVNTAPHFTVTSFAAFKSPLNSVSSRQITEMIDDETNPITLSATLIVSVFSYALPAFISITGDTIVSSPTALSHIGSYTLKLKIMDGGGLFSTQNIVLTVSNTAPYFTSNPLNQTVKFNNTLVFSLPSQIDDEGNTITMANSCTPTISGSGAFNCTHFVITFTDWAHVVLHKCQL